MNDLYEKMVETVLADKALNQDFPEFREVLSQGGQLYLFAFSEKLTELIVQECVSVLSDMHMWQSTNHQNNPAAWHDAIDQAIETIEEHFEIEESSDLNCPRCGSPDSGTSCGIPNCGWITGVEE